MQSEDGDPMADNWMQPTRAWHQVCCRLLLYSGTGSGDLLCHWYSDNESAQDLQVECMQLIQSMQGLKRSEGALPPPTFGRMRVRRSASASWTP